MTELLRVGIIGVSATGGWARDSHVPAVQALEGLDLVAVAANSRETADAAASAFGVGKAYAGGAALIADPDIDLVTVATRVPDHRDLVLAAIGAGKHVYSEWPLGRGVDEAAEMARSASAAGIRTAIGLQLRASPVAARARDLIADGAIGRLLGLNVYSAAAGFGPKVAAPFAYLEDPANFANLITIQGGHTVDLATALGGPIAGLQALATAQYPTIRVGPEGETRERTTFDHLLLQARLAGDATLAIEVSGGRPPETPFRLDAVGDKGVLRLDGGAPRGFQSGRLRLSLDGAPVAVDEGQISALPDAAANVASVSAGLRDDIRRGTSGVLGFDHAVRLTRLLEATLRSSAARTWVRAADWP